MAADQGTKTEAAVPAVESQKEARSKDEIALELMKFIAVTTGYGKGATGAGFSGKPAKSAEDYADALIQLFERCRSILAK